MYIGLLVVVSYLISDVLAAWFDPRARRMDRVRT
jgi:ABC-type dipeptide/oligopeptide/nickel transport system permease component